MRSPVVAILHRTDRSNAVEWGDGRVRRRGGWVPIAVVGPR